MAEMARKHHDSLQEEDLNSLEHEMWEMSTELILDGIPNGQTLQDPMASPLNWIATEAHTEKALKKTKKGSATGMDGCPYELWKTLQARHNEASHTNLPSFNVIKTITAVFNDIQTFGLDEESTFALGWMCPIYKKKDPTEISNYRPITLLNTDYKLLTKVLAIQLMDHIEQLIHQDQAGFIPRRSILDQIKLAESIIAYAEIANENGALVALDQEKAYDKIRHDYLWKTLEAFHLPLPFINTIKSLYSNASTTVAINGILSKPYKVTRGVRQGDPISCPLFDLAIEPLACMIRNDPNMKGITVPNLADPIKITLFADDTMVYLNRDDRLDYLQGALQDWCQTSGARFNLGKTEIIPIGTPEHRTRVTTTRKIHPQDATPIDDNIKLARDGDAVRYLGAWIGNRIDDIASWEPNLEKTHKDLCRWSKMKPTMKGRRLIVQSVVGGRTQFLTKAQGMPPHIENALTKIIRDFMWEDDSSPRIALDFLHSPVENGGLKLLDIPARNDAIEIMWLKEYLNLTPRRPKWALITDLIIDAAAPPNTNKTARMNIFLQTWNAPTRGQRAKILNKGTIRMIKVAKKYNTELAAIRLAPNLRALLPAWYHMASDPRPLTNIASKCLLRNHSVVSVADLIRVSARIRTPNPLHQQDLRCICPDCVGDRIHGCRQPQMCAQEAADRLNAIAPKFNPLKRENHGNFSLTRRRTERNEIAKATQGYIVFDPSITSKNDLAECFRIFTNPDKITNIPAERLQGRGCAIRQPDLEVYTDGACYNNGKEDARCGSGVWFAPNHPWNSAIRVPGNKQSNQIGEIVAVITAVKQTPPSWPLKIHTDSMYAIEGLTTHLREWEDRGWIGIENAKHLKKAAYLLKKRTATTSFKWVKGHNGNLGNEESDRLAKEGADKDIPDIVDLAIPKEYDIQGAKLAALTQALAYKGIQERKARLTRPTADINLERAKYALHAFSGILEKDETIWRGMNNPALRTKVRQFMYKNMHGTQKVGEYWAHIPNQDDRITCHTCHRTESMEHILTSCQAPAREMIWNLAKHLWPYPDSPWPEITMGIILGCGSLSTYPPDPPPRENDANQRPPNRGGRNRLLQILISEATHLIWVIRCERVIQERPHTVEEIKTRWIRAINRRLTEDKLIATKIQRDKTAFKREGQGHLGETIRETRRSTTYVDV